MACTQNTYKATVPTQCSVCGVTHRVPPPYLWCVGPEQAKGIWCGRAQVVACIQQQPCIWQPLKGGPRATPCAPATSKGACTTTQRPDACRIRRPAMQLQGAGRPSPSGRGLQAPGHQVAGTASTRRKQQRVGRKVQHRHVTIGCRWRFASMASVRMVLANAHWHSRKASKQFSRQHRSSLTDTAECQVIKHSSILWC